MFDLLKKHTIIIDYLKSSQKYDSYKSNELIQKILELVLTYSSVGI